MTDKLILNVNNLNIAEENNSTVIKDLTFKVEKNSITTIFAPLGSGKTTSLKIINENRYSKNIQFFGKRSFYIPQHSIIPNNLTVKNVIKLYTDEVHDKKVKTILNLVGLEGYENHVPNLESKGFLFRIALAVGLILNADMFLLDDVFLKMKNLTKIEIFNLLLNLKKRIDITFLIASSNYTDSILISDKIVFAKGNPFEKLFEEKIELKDENVQLRLQSELFLKIKDDLNKKLSDYNLRDFVL